MTDESNRINDLSKRQIKTDLSIARIEGSVGHINDAVARIERTTERISEALHGSRGIVERVATVESIAENCPAKHLDDKIELLQETIGAGKLQSAEERARAGLWYRILGAIAVALLGGGITIIVQMLGE